MSMETSTPVIGSQFFNRERELAALASVMDDALQGVRRWVALLGHRKIGKTSLALEFLRRHHGDVLSPYVDCWEARADPVQFLCGILRAGLRAGIGVMGAEAKIGPINPEPDGRLSATTVQALARLNKPSLDTAVRLHDEIATGRLHAGIIRQVFDLPGGFASDFDRPVVVILDEFQEMDRLNRLRRLEGEPRDIFGLLRSLWQQQQGVSYIVAGSRMTLLRELLTEETSPFFQHFELMTVGPFPRSESLKMLQTAVPAAMSPARRTGGTQKTHSAQSGQLTKGTTAECILDLLGDHPFYVRALLREAQLASLKRDATDDEAEQALREAFEAALLDQNGRLSLFMEQRYRVVVGNSSTLEAVLRGFVEPARITDVAEALHVRTGAVSTAVKTLMTEDVLVKRDDGLYAFADATFALWLRHQVDFRQAMPPLLVGTDSEKAVARPLARAGFRGVYQSRASRGAFDLLAIHDTRVFGIQVKTAKLPFSLNATQKRRLLEDARRLGFRPVLALLLVGDEVRFFDLKKHKGPGALKLRHDTPYADTLLALL